MTSRPPEEPTGIAELEAPAPVRRGRWKLLVPLTLTLVAAVVGATLLLSSSHTPSPLAVLQHAPERTNAARTADIGGGVTITLLGVTRKLVAFSGRESFSPRALDLQVSAAGLASESRVVDGVEYFSQPIVPLPGGAKWVRVTPAQLGVTSQSSSPFGSSDPTAGLEFLRAANGRPILVGHETLDGEAVTHYRFTLDLTSLTRKLVDLNDRVGATRLAEGIAKLGTLIDLHHVSAEAWIDGAGRVHRFDFGLSLPGAANGHARETTELRFSHFGVPVHVDAPPASEVVSFADVPNLFRDIENRALHPRPTT